MPVKGTTKTTYMRDSKLAVIRRRMRGETTREIAKAEGIARNTVIRILSLPEVQEARAKSRGLILARAPELSNRLVQIGLGEATKGDRQAIVDALRGIGVLTSIRDALHPAYVCVLPVRLCTHPGCPNCP